MHFLKRSEDPKTHLVRSVEVPVAVVAAAFPSTREGRACKSQGGQDARLLCALCPLCRG